MSIKMPHDSPPLLPRRSPTKIQNSKLPPNCSRLHKIQQTSLHSQASSGFEFVGACDYEFTAAPAEISNTIILPGSRNSTIAVRRTKEKGASTYTRPTLTGEDKRDSSELGGDSVELKSPLRRFLSTLISGHQGSCVNGSDYSPRKPRFVWTIITIHPGSMTCPNCFSVLCRAGIVVRSIMHHRTGDRNLRDVEYLETCSRQEDAAEGARRPGRTRDSHVGTSPWDSYVVSSALQRLSRGRRP